MNQKKNKGRFLPLAVKANILSQYILWPIDTVSDRVLSLL